MMSSANGWRHVEATERRTTLDFAQQMRWLVDEAYPDVQVIRVVLDNLNTHSTASTQHPRGAGWLVSWSSKHAQARQLAQRCGVRAGGPGPPVPQPTSARPRHRPLPGRRLETATQRRTAHRQVALHDRSGTSEAQARLSPPGVISMVIHTSQFQPSGLTLTLVRSTLPT